MAGYKETPRQKMIGMMYLVLTALLALNVSKQILDAFVLVNDTVETTNSNFNQKLEGTYTKFQKQYQIDPKKTQKYWEKAQIAKKLSADLTKYFDSLKYVVIANSEKIPLDSAKIKKLKDINRKDNYDFVTSFFIGTSDLLANGEGYKMQRRIEDYKKKMMDLVEPQYKASIDLGFKMDGPYYNASKQKEDWVKHTFYRTILAACVTILNQMKAETYNAEFDVVNSLLAAISADDWKFDEIKAKVIPKSSFVFTGEDYQAEILVAAYDTTSKVDVRYVMGSDTMTNATFENGTKLTKEKGTVILKVPAGAEGLRKFAGMIKIISPSGEIKTYNFKNEFMVARPAVTISPTKMNVFYCEVDNPVQISVPGNPSNIIPRISIGSISKSADGKGWIVNNLPLAPKDPAVITVSAVFAGKARDMGNFPFRVKKLPDPIAKVGGVNSGRISKMALVGNPFVLAEMIPGFDFELRFRVKSYTLSENITGEWRDHKVVGESFPPEVIKLINTAKKGSVISIENVTVKGPVNERSISGCTLKIN